MAEFEQYYLGKTQSDNVDNKEPDFNSSPNVLQTSKSLVVKNVFRATDAETALLKGHRIGITEATSPNTAISSTDFFVIVQSVAVAKTVTLPSAVLSGIGKVYVIKDISGSASATTITISPQSGETINGDTSTSINTNYGFVGLFTDGNDWFTS